MLRKTFIQIVGIIAISTLLNSCYVGKTPEYAKHQIVLERINPHLYLIDGYWCTQFECWWRVDNKYLFVTYEKDTAYYWVGRTETVYMKR